MVFPDQSSIFGDFLNGAATGNAVVKNPIGEVIYIGELRGALKHDMAAENAWLRTAFAGRITFLPP